MCRPILISLNTCVNKFSRAFRIVDDGKRHLSSNAGKVDSSPIDEHVTNHIGASENPLGSLFKKRSEKI